MKNCWIEISPTHLTHNIRTLTRALPKKTKLMCVIKANAYGHGFSEMSTLLIKNPHVDWFGVFDFEDALTLRKKTQKPILVLCTTKETDWDTAYKKNISITLSTLEQIQKLTTYKYAHKLKWHLKVDTGLGRQGLTLDALLETLALCDAHTLHPEGLFSHLAGVEEQKFDQYSFSQYEQLMTWKKAFGDIHIHPQVHLSGTAGVLRYDLFGLDMVRVGIGLYGLWPSHEVQKNIPKKDFLKPVLSFKTRISEIKKLPKGKAIAYDCTYILTRDSTIAILPIGYWDGIPRALSSNGYVLIHGQKAPILGRIMMNMCIVDITDIPKAKTEDIVTIIGKDKGQEITADTVAVWANTINYEVVTRLNPLISRTITGLQKKDK